MDGGGRYRGYHSPDYGHSEGVEYAPSEVGLPADSSDLSDHSRSGHRSHTYDSAHQRDAYVDREERDRHLRGHESGGGNHGQSLPHGGGHEHPHRDSHGSRSGRGTDTFGRPSGPSGPFGPSTSSPQYPATLDLIASAPVSTLGDDTGGGRAHPEENGDYSVPTGTVRRLGRDEETTGQATGSGRGGSFSHRAGEEGGGSVSPAGTYAGEMVQLRVELRKQREYSQLCEERLRELVPDHPLPVTRACLGQPLPSSLLPHLPAADVRNTPSYIVSTNAAHRRETDDLVSAYEKLERAYQTSQDKLDASRRHVTELQRKLESAQRDRTNALHRAEALASKVARFEEAPASGRHSSRSGRSGRPHDSHDHSHGGHRGGGDEDRRSIADARPDFEAQAREAAADKTKALDALAHESRALDEARAYIAVLESALRTSGGSDAHSELLGELSRVRSELETRTSDCEARETASRRLSEQLAELQTRHDRISARLERLQKGEGTPARVAQLETEQDALMDYLQARKAEIDQLMEANRELESKERELNAALDSVRKDLNQERMAKTDALDQAAVLRRHLSGMEADKVAAESQLSDAQAALDSLRQELGRKTHEVDENAAVQVELLNTIREHKHDADDLRSKLETSESSLSSVRASLSAIEADKARLEGDMQTMNQQVADMRKAGEAKQKLVQELETDLAQAMTDLERTRTDLTSSTERLLTAQSRIELLENTKESLDVKITSVEAELRAATHELQALRRTKASIDTAEAKLEIVGEAESTIEMEEERLMGQRREYDSGAHVVDPGAGGGASQSASVEDADVFSAQKSVAPFQYGVSFQFGSASQQEEEDPDKTLPAVAGRIALARAERSADWSGAAEVVASIPHVSAAARRMAGWLRAAGVALQESARALGTERREKRVQRRMLHDEIHSLRQKCDGLEASLKDQESALTVAEASANQASRDRDADVTRLSATIEQLQVQLSSTQTMLQSTSSSLEDSENRVHELSGQVESTTKQLDTAQQEYDRAISRALAAEETGRELALQVERLSSELEIARLESEDLQSRFTAQTEQLTSLQRSAETEKRIFLEKIASLEGKEVSSAADLGSLASELGSTTQELAATREQHRRITMELADLRAKHEAFVAEAKQQESSLVDTKAQLERRLRAAEESDRSRAELVARLETQLSECSSEKTVMQRSVVNLTMSLESSRHSLHATVEETKRRLGSASAGSDMPSMLEDLGFSDSRGSFGSPSSRRSGSPLSRQHGDDLSRQLSTVVASVTGLVRRLAENHIATIRRLADSTAQLERMRASMDSAKPHIQALEQASSSAAQRMEALVTAEARVADLSAAMAGLKSENSVLEEEVTALRRQVLSLQSQNEQQGSQLAAMAGESDAARDAKRQALDRANEAERRCRELEEENRHLRGAVDAEAETIMRQHKSLCSDSEQLSDLQVELSQAKAARSRLQSQVSEMQTALSGARQELAKATTELTTLQHRESTAVTKAKRLEDEVASLRQELSSVHEQHMQSERSITADIIRLSSDQQASVKAREDLVNQLREAKREAAAAQTEVARQAEVNAITVSELEETRARATRAEAQIAAYERRAREAMDAQEEELREAGKVAAFAEAMRDRLNQTQEEVSRLRAQVDTKQAAASQMQHVPSSSTPAVKDAPEIVPESRPLWYSFMPRPSEVGPGAGPVPTSTRSRSSRDRVYSSSDSEDDEDKRSSRPSGPPRSRPNVSTSGSVRTSFRASSFSARSGRSPSPSSRRSPSPGAARIQERLRRVQMTFANLRKTAETHPRDDQ